MQSTVMRRTRLILALGATTIALVAGAAPAAAATQVIENGAHGGWFVNDSNVAPGFVCKYHTTDDKLFKITIKPPALFASDLKPKREHQQVGWRYRVQQTHDAVVWNTVFTSSKIVATAYDDTPAVFGSRSQAIASPNDQYRVEVDAYWYAPLNPATQVGSVTLRYSFVRAKRGITSYVSPNYCLEAY
jgi:hypothetical protein